MEKYLIKEIKQMKGSLLGIGITSEKIKDAINKNDEILICNLLEETTKRKNSNLVAGKKQRKVNIKKLRKTFRKKRTDNVICNLETVKKFLKTFVRDSVYINKGKLYIYGDKEEIETLKKKYERYTKDIKIINKAKQSILVVNNTNTKNNKFKDICYWWQDFGQSTLEIITALLAN